MGDLVRDAAALGASMAGAFVWVRSWEAAAARSVVSSLVARKVLHITCAPIFAALWPLFSDRPRARWLACLVPANMVLRMVAKQKDLGKAVSRTGDVDEVVRGPLIYVVVLGLCTALWRSNVAAILAVMQMSFGDGFAEVFGRTFRGPKWPGLRNKSFAGTVGFVSSSFVSSLLAVAYFKNFGLLALPPLNDTAPKILLISFACSLAELSPMGVNDNITVPLTALFLSRWCLT